MKKAPVDDRGFLFMGPLSRHFGGGLAVPHFHHAPLRGNDGAWVVAK
jgi:hypothetical protein